MHLAQDLPELGGDLPDLPHARNHLAGYVDGGRVCVAGGRVPGTSTAIDCYDPTAGTWAVYHVADKLWERVEQHYDRPTKAAMAVFAVQARLERGVYDERPCFHCGWNWGKGADDDARPFQNAHALNRD